MKKNSIWDKIAWVVLVLIVIWLILKLLGVFNTPILLEYSPLFGAVYLAGWAMNKLERATEDIKDIKKEMNDVESDMVVIRKNCPKLKR